MQNKPRYASMYELGFEPMIPAFEWLKIVFALHRTDSVIGPNMVRVIKSRMTRWAGYVASIGKTRYAYESLVGKLLLPS
jgi:hypothetical protein